MHGDDPQHDLDTLLSRIAPALNPEEVYLFGSRARGDFNKDSDYDLFVVLPDDAPDEAVSMVSAHKLTLGTKIWTDVIPCRQHRFQTWRNVKGSLVYRVAQEGVRVYARA